MSGPGLLPIEKSLMYDRENIPMKSQQYSHPSRTHIMTTLAGIPAWELEMPHGPTLDERLLAINYCRERERTMFFQE